MTAKRRAHSTTTYDAIERPYPRVLRTTVDADRDLRAYAAEYEIEPYEALVVAIDRLRDPVESEALRASLDAAGKLAERLAADLESAREATRRADAEIERLTRELAASQARERQADEGAMDARAEAAPCACALPDDFEAKIAERAPGWKGTLPELRARVITLGFSRYDALATDAAKRAAERGR